MTIFLSLKYLKTRNLMLKKKSVKICLASELKYVWVEKSQNLRESNLESVRMGSCQNRKAPEFSQSYASEFWCFPSLALNNSYTIWFLHFSISSKKRVKYYSQTFQYWHFSNPPSILKYTLSCISLIHLAIFLFLTFKHLQNVREWVIQIRRK